MAQYRRMIRCPNGQYEEFELVAMRVNPDNPREVTLIFDESVAELSRDDRHNHFVIGFVSANMIPKLKSDRIDSLPPEK